MRKVCSALLVMLLSISVLSFSSISQAANAVDQMGNDPWLSLFHDSQNTKTSAAAMKMPLKEGIMWEREGGTASFFASPPAIYNNIAYIPYMADGRARTAELIAMDFSSGEFEEIWRVEYEGLLRTSPVIDPENERIFIMLTSGFGTKDAGTNSTVYCLSMEDGSEEWSGQVDGASFTSPAFDAENNKIFLSTFWIDKEENKLSNLTFDYHDSEGAFYCLDGENGDLLWEAELDGGSVSNSTAAIADGVVYVTNGNLWFSSAQGFYIPAFRSSPLYAFDEEDGSLLWTYNAGESTGFTGSPSVEDGKVYVSQSFGSFQGLNSVVTCLDAESGEEEWTYDYASFSSNFAPIITADEVLFVANDSSLYALNKNTGKKLWSKKVSDSPQPYIDLVFFGVACDGFVFTQGYNLDGNKVTGYRLQVFDLEAKGKSIFKEDVEDTPVGVSVYGNSVFFVGYVNILEYHSETPVLSVSPDKIDLGKVERATKKEVKILVKNIGIEGMEETVTVSDPWMTVNAETINDDTKDILLTVNTTGLLVQEYFGKVIFEGNGGNKSIPVTFKVIDTQAPKIEWDYSTFVQVGEDWYTNQKELLLKGQTEPMAIVKINGQEAEVDAEGLFEFSITLQEGKNEISYETADDIPNQTTATLVLFLDTKAPLLTLTTEDYSLFTEASAYIMGQTDDKEAVITINGETVPIAPNGSFAKMVVLEKGVNKFTVEAKDKIGNVTSVEMHLVYPDKKLIILVIGKKDAEVNGDVVKLDVPPMIQKGRTLVPIRFVSESFGAEVGYVKEEQKVTVNLYGKLIEIFINRTTAKVNGQPVILDLPAMIIQGRTLVPLRFVSENLGAKVDWDGKTQTITITFPAPQ